MKQLSNILKIGFWFIFGLIFITIFNQTDKNINKELLDEVKIQVEKAYASGQIHAINGVLKIKQIDDSTYVWTSSIWNNGDNLTDTVIINIH